MAIDMGQMAQDIEALKAEVSADQVFLMILAGYLKKVGFIDRQFLDGLIEDYKKNSPDTEQTKRVAAILEQRFQTILPK